MKSKIFTIVVILHLSSFWLSAMCISDGNCRLYNKGLNLSGNMMNNSLYKNKSYTIYTEGQHGLVGDNLAIAFSGLEIEAHYHNANGIVLKGTSNVATGDNFRGVVYYDSVVHIGSENTNTILNIGNNAKFRTFGSSTAALRVGLSGSRRPGINGVYIGNNANFRTHHGVTYTGYPNPDHVIHVGTDPSEYQTSGSAAVHIGDSSNIEIKNGNGVYAVYVNEGGNVILGSTKIRTSGFRVGGLAVESTNASMTGIYLGGNIKLLGDTDIIVSSQGSHAAVALGNKSTIKSKGSHLYRIRGNIRAGSGGIVDLNMSDGSKLYGKTEIDNNKRGIINLSFNGTNSMWLLDNRSALSTLTLNEWALVNLQDRNAKSLTIDNLAGNNGVFVQKLDIAGKDKNINLIVVNNSSSGNYTLTFDDRNLESVKGFHRNGAFLVVQQNNPNGNYNADYGGMADIGGYIYFVQKGDTSIGQEKFSQYLVNSGRYSSRLTASIGLLNTMYLSNYIDTTTLMQRMGEIDVDRKIKDDVWIRGYYGNLNSFKKNLYLKSADYNGFMAGADRVYNLNNANLYLGFALGLSNTNTHYESVRGGSKNYNFGLYSTYKSINGFYLDSLIKYHTVKNSFSSKTSNGYATGASGNAKGFSISVEGGKKLNLKNSNFYVEPQVQLTYALYNGFKINSPAFNVKASNFNSLISRISAIVGYKLNKINMYLKFGYMRELLGKTDYLLGNGENVIYKLNNSALDNAIGVSTSYKYHHFHFEGTYQIGDMYKNKKVNMGYRYSF